LPKNKKENDNIQRINVLLSPKLGKRLDEYLLAVANKRGIAVLGAVRTKIGRMAITEWLDNHEKDLDINFEEEQ
jgi:hypothetical protein